MLGDNELWKYAQNIPKKNKASDIINKPTPIFRPLWTAKVWLPKYVPSLITSLHQKDIDNIKLARAIYKKYIALENPCIVSTRDVVKVNKDILVFKGQGDGDTRWKGWAWKLLLVIFLIVIFSQERIS